MKKNNTKAELATAIIVTLLFTSMFQMLNVYGANASRQTNLTQISKSTPRQKINQFLKDQMEQNSTLKNQTFRILIRCNPNMKTALPKGLKILKEFKFVPLTSALASSLEIEELTKLEGVEYIYPDTKVQALNFNPQQMPSPRYPEISNLRDAPLATQAVPRTPWFGDYPCFLNESTTLIGANKLWTDGITGKGVIIAILDTGINKYHPDLDDMDDNPATCDPKVLAEQVFIEEPLWEIGNPSDLIGHGTHCASIAAGTGGTGAMGYYGTYFGYNFFSGTIPPGTERGVAPGAYLYNVKVLNSYGYGYDSWIIAGIEWAMEHGADVISMSFGGWPLVPPEEDPLALASGAAVEHGVVCVVAAGNSGWGYFSLESPGFDPKVITVGATTETDELALFSSRGPEEYELHAKPDILAPGTCVVAAFAFFDSFEDAIGQQAFYLELSGTSMAAPHVAGAAALLLQTFPGATPYAVKSAMMLGADDLGLDPMAQGAGRLNVAKAHGIMVSAPKQDSSVMIPTNTVTPAQPMLTAMPNLTGVDILLENSFCSPWKMSTFINMLTLAGATITYSGGPYSNDSVVHPGTGQPLYDVFILSEPYVVNEAMLPPSVLAHYVEHNGTLLFTGDRPTICKDYTNWTKQWGISWNNTAVGGLSTNIAAHAITNGISEIYFGSPIASLILDTSVTPSPKCVIWDPVFPGVAVWESQAPSTGKVVVLSDDGILTDQYLFAADNLAFGFNIIKWFTKTLDVYASGVETPLLPPIESPHPYPENADLWYPVSAPGAKWLSIHFTMIDVEQYYDYIEIYDQFMNLVEYYSGHYEDVWTKPVFGDVALIRLVSDSSVEYWGFLADAYLYGSIVPSMVHEIGIGATWEKYVIANSTFKMNVDVQNFGNYTEDVMLSMTLVNSTGSIVINNWNFKNVTVAAGAKVTVEVTPEVILNATTLCKFAGPQSYLFAIVGMIYNSSSGSPPYPEIDFSNNFLIGEISAVPKTARSGPNPLLSVITPMKITSNSAPLITMYPNDFTMHNITAFVSGGELESARFEITGNVATIADFVNVTTFARHYSGEIGGEWIVDPSPAYFIPNMTAIIGDTLLLAGASAPTMFSAELQVYISPGTPEGTYAGKVQLVNGTDVLASADLTFEVRSPKSKVLWEDYFNDYRFGGRGPYWGTDCERLWGGAFTRYVGGSVGLFEWWKQVANAGFDVDSLHQQLYFNQHLGFLGSDTKDPMQVIAYGGYNTLFLDDVDYPFSFQEISVFQRLYEEGKMNFVVLFNARSEGIDMFTTNYGISINVPYMMIPSPPPPQISDLLITGIDKTHPIFDGVENFTLSLYPYEGGYFLRVGPFILSEGFLQSKGNSKGIATGTDDFGFWDTSGFVVAVNELQATPHITSRMVVVSDGNMFESLEYEDLLIWLNLYVIAGENINVSRVDTDRFAVNMLRWLTSQFANESPVVDYFDVTPTTAKLGEAVSVDAVVHDPEGDNFTVTIAVQKPENSWDNATVPSVGGHWLRNFTIDLEGIYAIYVIATDSYGATTSMPVGTVKTVNTPPEILSVNISPSRVTQGETVFITLNTKDAEDGVPLNITVSVIAPNGTSYHYNFSNVAFATMKFDTSNMPEGVYSVNATLVDANGAQTTANIGFFEVEQPPPSRAEFPIREAIFGLGIIALVALILTLLLIYQRLSGRPATP